MKPAAQIRRRVSDLSVLVGCCALAIAGLLRVTAADLPTSVSGLRLVGLTAHNTLVHFAADRPTEVSTIRISRVAGHVLGIDYRPVDGQLYAVTSANNLYTIDPLSGMASLVCTLTLPFDGGSRSGFDFNPQADRLRIIGSNGQNLRVHPSIGAVAADTALTYERKDRNFGKVPSVVAVAYTNSVPQASATKTFDIDAALDILALQEPPNDGTLRTIGRLGVDFDVAAGFDILTDDHGNDHAFAVSGSRLYSIDLATGLARLMETVGAGNLQMIGLAIVPVRGARSR